MNDDKIFIQDFEGNSKKGLIFVDDDSDVIIEQDAPTSDTEVSSASASAGTPHPHPHKWRWIALSIFASVVFCLAAYVGWRLYNYYYNIGVPVSVTPEENIQKLAQRFVISCRTGSCFMAFYTINLNQIFYFFICYWYRSWL